MIKRLGVFLLKSVIVLPLFLFSVWIVLMVYGGHAEGRKLSLSPEPAQPETVFKKILRTENPVAREHFHMLDEHVTQVEPYQPLCLTCHGTYPHSKDEKLRSLLNFHTGYMACAVCHARKGQNDDNRTFAWVDRHSGTISKQVVGEYGKYPAKIFPVDRSADGALAIFRPVDEHAAQEYLEFKDQYTPDQVSQVKIKLHERLSEKPILCTECHRRNGYIDFADLGFAPQRIGHLASTEVAGMVEKYETFYMPGIINFGLQGEARKGS